MFIKYEFYFGTFLRGFAIMPRLVFVFLVTAVFSQIHVRSSHARDLDSVLNILTRHLQNGNDDKNDDRSSLSIQLDKGSLADSDVEVQDRWDALRTEDVAELFNKVPLLSSKNNLKDTVSKDRKQRISKQDNFDLLKESRSPHVKNSQKALEALLAQSLNQILESKLAQATEEVNVPAISSNINSDKKDDVNGLDKYSKVYILLNPDALAKSKNKQFLNELLSQLMPTSSSKRHDRKNEKKSMKYKGFLVSNDARRVRRDSSEVYAPKDSMEEDYKPKRGRNSGGSGGGGAGGRTAIPYIRHRGDIYEKDN